VSKIVDRSSEPGAGCLRETGEGRRPVLTDHVEERVRVGTLALLLPGAEPQYHEQVRRRGQPRDAQDIRVPVLGVEGRQRSAASSAPSCASVSGSSTFRKEVLGNVLHQQSDFPSPRLHRRGRGTRRRPTRDPGPARRTVLTHGRACPQYGRQSSPARAERARRRGYAVLPNPTGHRNARWVAPEYPSAPRGRRSSDSIGPESAPRKPGPGQISQTPGAHRGHSRQSRRSRSTSRRVSSSHSPAQVTCRSAIVMPWRVWLSSSRRASWQT